MNRIDALREVGQFVKRYQPIFAALPRDTDGKPSNIEIRKWLAVDPEMAIALAAVLAVLSVVLENEARAEATQAFAGSRS